MTSIKTLVASSALLAVAGMALADPTMKVLPAAIKSGQATSTFVVEGILGGATSLLGAEIHVKFDPAKVTVTNAAANFVPATGWSTAGFNVDTTKNEAIWAGSNGDGQTANGPIVTITFAGTGGGVLTLTKDSNITDQDYTPWYPAADQTAAVINGAIRTGLGAIAGAPSTGPGKVVAVAAGGSLKLLDADTLADKAGFTAPAVGAVSGRPVFGVSGTTAIIAVGDDAGKLTIADAASGAVIAAPALGAKVSTPAIAPDAVYAGVNNATGVATLVKVVGTTVSPVASLAGNTVTGAPAVYQGGIAVGTEKGIESFRSDGTPQAGLQDAAGATVAPIVGPGGKALSANAAKILGFNIVTGAPTASTPHTGGVLSEAWYDAATDNVIFGGDAGKLLRVNLTTGVPTLDANAIATGKLSAEPIVLGGVAWAEAADGTVVSDAGASLPLAGPAATALAATGRTSGTDDLIAATADGTVASMIL